MIEIQWHAPLLEVAALTNLSCSGEQAFVFADTMALLKTNAASLCYKFAVMRGYFAAGDGLGKLYWWNRTDTRADDGNTIVNPDGNAGPGRWNAFV